MKHNRKNNISAWLSVLALLLTTACADHADLYLSQAGNENSNIVEITVQPPVSSLMTRVDGDEDGTTQLSHISDGSKVNVLIYALYEKLDDGTYEIVKNPEIKGMETSNSDANMPQGHIRVSLKKENYPYRIQPKLDPKKEYKMVFWAQAEDCKAYDITKGLTEVKVDYTNAQNNDELRDAFCTSIEINNKKNRYEAILRRPFAQINVGTTGWDYEGAAYLKPSSASYVKSQITLDGVAQYYNILAGKALDQIALDKALEQKVGDENYEKATTTAVFTLNRIPAFINSTKEEWEKKYTPVDKEEYLKVHVDKNTHEGYYPYVGWEQYEEYRKGTIDGKYGYTKDDETKTKFLNGEHPDTETFKYLSMCYVLVPEKSDLTNLTPSEDSNITDLQLGAVLNSVKFEAKGIEYKDATVTTPSPEEEGVPAATEDAATEEDDEFKKEFTINNVPVQKNWRTNILGNSFFIGTEKFKIDIVPDYMGDYNFNSDGSRGEEIYYVSFNTKNADCKDGSKDMSEGFFTFPHDAKHELQHEHFDCFPPDYSPSTPGETNESRFRYAKYTGTLLRGNYPEEFKYCLKAGRRGRIKFTIDTPSTIYILLSTGKEYKLKENSTTDYDFVDGLLTVIPDNENYMENYMNEDYILTDKDAITEGCSPECRLLKKDLDAGTYIIKTFGMFEKNDPNTKNWLGGSGECGLYYIEVQPQTQFRFPNEDLDEDIKNDYYGTNKDNNQGE